MKSKLFVLLLVIVCGFTSLYAQDKEQPNVILILADDQGWGATSVQMDPEIPESASDFYQTPNLEKLADSGMRFTRGYAPHPNCSPSRGSIQTGKSPAKLHLTDIVERPGGKKNTSHRLITPPNLQSLPKSEITIAELIKQNRPEYSTAYFGKWHLEGGGPEEHGYDVSDGATTNREGNRHLPGNPKDIFGITKRGIAFMEKNVKSNHPFFLTLAHYATHNHIEYLPSSLKKFKDLPAGKRHSNAAHAAMTYDLDTGVGMIMDKVKQLGISENTYIIYLSDNGSFPKLNPSNTNGPIRGWKATLWEGGIRVPFMISGPGIKAGSVSKARVVGYDLYPTIATWLGIDPIPDGVEGGALNETLKNGGKGEIKRPNDFLVFHWPRYVVSKGSQPSTIIYEDEFKLHKFYETGELRLYDINDDVDESDIVNNVYPTKTNLLYWDMMNYLDSIVAGIPRVNPNYDASSHLPEKYLKIKNELMGSGKQ